MDTHLRWHPLLALRVDQREVWSTELMWRCWRSQVTEMHQLCKERGQSWAWEYLWRNWYNPWNWPHWARAAHKELPIINSNAVVEAMWGALKKWYLRKHARASLELLAEILMRQYLRDRALCVYFHRTRSSPPPAYHEFVVEWRNRGQQVLIDDAQFEEDDADDADADAAARETLADRARRLYQTDINGWWCGCCYFKASKNHVCKHLVRLYTEWNTAPSATTIPIPLWGYVFRQRTSPVLFICGGLHEEADFTSIGLWPLEGEDLLPRDLARPPPPVADEQLGQHEPRGQENRELTPHQAPGAGENLGDEARRQNDQNIQDMVQDVARQDEVQQGREIHRKLDVSIARLEKILTAFREARAYPAGHHHLREIPVPELSHFRSWESYIRRQATLANARLLRPTWGPERQGNMFG